MQWYTNPWFIGITTGIISGVIVFFITNFIVKKRSNSVHNQAIQQANSELLFLMNPYIANGDLPREEIINSIISALSRKYNLQISEIYDLKTLYEELLTVIVGNVFISNEIKNSYTEKIIEKINKLDRKTYDNPSKVTPKDYTVSRNFRMSISFIFSVSACIITMLISILISFSFDGALANSYSNIFIILIVLLGSTLLYLVLMVLILLLIKYRKTKKDKEDKEE